tara:strand:+ start:312 stop:449 length:138 start_codon:yes stop_codon:yes gene_type:complete
MKVEITSRSDFICNHLVKKLVDYCKNAPVWPTKKLILPPLIGLNI